MRRWRSGAFRLLTHFAISAAAVRHAAETPAIRWHDEKNRIKRRDDRSPRSHIPPLVLLRHRRFGHAAAGDDPQGPRRRIAGSDRSRDQGRNPEKFAWLEAQGIELFPQDGSGVTSADQVLVASAAVEDTVLEMVRAREFGCERMSRAELLSPWSISRPARSPWAGPAARAPSPRCSAGSCNRPAGTRRS